MNDLIPLMKNNGKYIAMYMQVRECPICKHSMINKEEHTRRSIFPMFIGMNQKAQAKELNLKFCSNTEVDDKLICQDCADTGKADFLCYLCKERKPTNKIEESVGILPTEYLCKDCYETVPAKKWDKALEELQEEHRYDYE